MTEQKKKYSISLSGDTRSVVEAVCNELERQGKANNMAASTWWLFQNYYDGKLEEKETERKVTDFSVLSEELSKLLGNGGVTVDAKTLEDVMQAISEGKYSSSIGDFVSTVSIEVNKNRLSNE